MHHAWIGGLLEHIVSLLGIADLAAGHYTEINRDLLLTGVILHDIGKLRELAWTTGFSYTMEGQLLGHITIGIGMVEKKIDALPDFPPKMRLLVEHLILSHHGQYEYGSPKLPMIPEAILTTISTIWMRRCKRCATSLSAAWRRESRRINLQIGFARWSAFEYSEYLAGDKPEAEEV